MSGDFTAVLWGVKTRHLKPKHSLFLTLPMRFSTFFLYPLLAMPESLNELLFTGNAGFGWKRGKILSLYSPLGTSVNRLSVLDWILTVRRLRVTRLNCNNVSSNPIGNLLKLCYSWSNTVKHHLWCTLPQTQTHKRTHTYTHTHIDTSTCLHKHTYKNTHDVVTTTVFH